MKTSDFLFDLPESQIAQTPIEPRDHSRMMCINRATGAISHEHFYNVIDHLQPNDALVINETRVIPARLYGERESGGACEVLLLRQIGPKRWETLVKPGKKLRPGAQISFGGGRMTATIVEPTDAGGRIVVLSCERAPLKPRWTSWAKCPCRRISTKNCKIGTAIRRCTRARMVPPPRLPPELHFTPELLQRIREKGVAIVPILLHVGLGTFRPVKVEDISEHVMHSEYCEVTPQAVAALQRRAQEEASWLWAPRACGRWNPLR